MERGYRGGEPSYSHALTTRTGLPDDPSKARRLVCDCKQEQPRRADESYHQDGEPEVLNLATGPQSVKHQSALRQPDPGLSLTSAAAVLTDAATVVRASHRLRAREAGYTDGSGQHGKRQRRENDDPLHVNSPI